MNFSLRTTFCLIYNFCVLWFHFSFPQDNFLISHLFLLVHWLCKRVLFNFHVFINFLLFLLLLISRLISLWSEKKLGMICLPEFAKSCFVITCSLSLENFPCELKKNYILLFSATIFSICLLAHLVYSVVQS